MFMIHLPTKPHTSTPNTIDPPGLYGRKGVPNYPRIWTIEGNNGGVGNIQKNHHSVL